VLLDSCVVIDWLRGKPSAAAFIPSLGDKPSVSVVTLTEVFDGLKSQRAEAAARLFFSQCNVRVLSRAIAEAAGMHLRHYRASHGTGLADALIAAAAEHHGLELATVNVRHFPMIKGLKRAY
jgi:hypothetical protein